MDQTFGFVEMWLAEILNIEFMKYALENGAVAAAVDKDGFDTAFNTINYLWDKLDKDPRLQPLIMNSNIHGMRLAVHRYWVDDNLLNDLTGEEAKASELYLNVVSVGTSGSRFTLDNIKDEINNHHTTSQEELPTEEYSGASNDVAVPEEEMVEVELEKPKEIPKWITRMKKILDNITNIKDCPCTDHDVSFDEERVRVVVFGSKLTETQFNLITDIAKSIKKSIVCLYSASHASMVLDMIKAEYIMSDLSKDVLFFTYSMPTITFLINEGMKALCFGCEIDEIHTIAGTRNENKAINDIRRETRASEENKERRIRDILKERKNSPIYKYDGVYKDTVTHVIWAVKDRCVVYFLVPYSTGKNKTFFKIAYKEFARRHSNSTPYNELVKIDIAYMEKKAINNKEEYIQFAMENSKAITNQIKKKKDEHHTKYKECLDQAMEHAKMFQRFHDQIAYFNEGEFMKDERKKANDNYDQTIAIDKISAITIKDGSVHVYTNNIYAQDERTKRWHDIGTFHIIIGMHSNTYDQSKTVRINNTKHQINAGDSIMNAPHVWNNGTFCHGNLAVGLTDAYKRRDLFEVVYQIILFLESANTSDAAGEKVNHWPEVSEEIATNINRNANVVYEAIEQIAEAEKKFDELLADAIPIHIN